MKKHRVTLDMKGAIELLDYLDIEYDKEDLDRIKKEIIETHQLVIHDYYDQTLIIKHGMVIDKDKLYPSEIIAG